MADALDQLVSSSEPAPLANLSMEDLRTLRTDLQAKEQVLSYVRRLVQGRLDIVVDERQHRDTGGGARDASALVADLPEILSEHVAGGGRGPLPEVTLPAGDIDGIIGIVDGIIGADQLGSISDLPAPELADMADRLAAFERRVSLQRRTLHTSIDAIQEEIVRRYKSGEASVDGLLR